MSNVVGETATRVRRWMSALQSVEQLRQQLNAAECELSNAKNDLGKWLVPPEHLTPDVPFNVWFGSGVLTAKRCDNNYEVSWLRKPDGKDKDVY